MSKQASLIIAGIVCSFTLQFCGSSFTEGLTTVPNAIGSVNQMVVICDKDIWEGPIGDTFRFRFESAYPLLPTPEPLFDVKYYEPIELVAHPLRRELRTYVYLADISNTESMTTQAVLEDLGSELPYKMKDNPDLSNMVGRDKWAKGQLIVYLFAAQKEQLAKVINKNFYAVTRRINEFDKSMIHAKVYLEGNNRPYETLLAQKFGARFEVPGDYVKATEDSVSLWLRKDDGVLISNIICHKVPYREEKQLSKEGIISLMDKVGKQFVTSNIPGSYLQVNNRDLPVIIYPKSLDDAYTLEARGIWELTLDYMGGPFLAYLIKHPTEDHLIFIGSFVYAPGKEKRDYIQHIEHIVNSLTFS